METTYNSILLNLWSYKSKTLFKILILFAYIHNNNKTLCFCFVKETNRAAFPKSNCDCVKCILGNARETITNVRKMTPRKRS